MRLNRNLKGIRTVLGGSVVLSAVAGLGLFAAPRAAQAQAPDTKAEQPVTLNFQGGDIQAVLKALFNDIGANYSIDSDVHGSVSISMSNVGFLAALRSVLRANNPPLTFEYADGVYHVKLKQQQPRVDATPVDTSSAPAPAATTPDQSASSSPDDMRYFRIPVDTMDVKTLATLIRSYDVKGVDTVPVGTVNGTSGSSGGGGGGGGQQNNGGSNRAPGQ